MEKFSNTQIYKCVKCGFDGGLKGHSISHMEERKTPSKYDGGAGPEHLMMNCYRCSALIGMFAPLDASNEP